MKNQRKRHTFFYVVCIENADNQASLERRKIYQALPDSAAATHRLIRIIDESGEDYLYPEDNFMPIDLPQAVEKALRVG